MIRLKLLDELNVSTVLVLLIALAGAVITVIHPETLAFKEYATITGGSAGVLGIGRGIAAHGRTKGR